jgi:enterochelin esterase-like enzyme
VPRRTRSERAVRPTRACTSRVRVVTGRSLFLLFAAVACTRREDPTNKPFQPPAPSVSASAAPARLPAEERTWSFPNSGIGRMSVVVVVPERDPGEKFPVLVAFHGRGETLKGPERGARGWVDDYLLAHAERRLAHPPLTYDDFENFVEERRLNALNQALAEHPYRGLIVACPYLPDMLARDSPFAQAPPLAKFVVETLLPKLYAETPALGTPAATGIDGVSLGGRASLAVGLLRPSSFGAVASLQAALEPGDANELASRALLALAKNPALHLRLLTSNSDYYLSALSQIHGALRAAKVPHDFIVVSGPHDYAFNRGPGAFEMLAYHDRVLRGFAPP